VRAPQVLLQSIAHEVSIERFGTLSTLTVVSAHSRTGEGFTLILSVSPNKVAGSLYRARQGRNTRASSHIRLTNGETLVTDTTCKELDIRVWGI
jgi:hypothetical protein